MQEPPKIPSYVHPSCSDLPPCYCIGQSSSRGRTDQPPLLQTPAHWQGMLHKVQRFSRQMGWRPSRARTLCESSTLSLRSILNFWFHWVLSN